MGDERCVRRGKSWGMGRGVECGRGGGVVGGVGAHFRSRDARTSFQFLFFGRCDVAWLGYRWEGSNGGMV